MQLEWARITDSTVVVATVDRAWLHELDPLQADASFAETMTGAGSLESTRRLLDAATAAGQRAASRNAGAKPPLTLRRYAWQLIGHYHTMHPTTPLMNEAAERFRALRRTELEEFARRTARQEKGHDLMAVRDLEELGYDARAMVSALCPSAAARLVEYFTRCVRTPEPVEAFGFMYGGERTSIAIGLDYVERVEAMLPAGVNATRALRVHSAAGADVDHVETSLATIAQLPADERTRIARAAYERTYVTFTPPEDGYPTEDELERAMSKFQLQYQTKEN